MIEAPTGGDVPLITPRVLIGLGVVALAQGVLTAACVLPSTAIMGVESLPAALCGTVLALALLLAPAWSSDPRRAGENAWRFAGRCAFLSLWLASALAFFLLLATRAVAFPVDAILRTSLIVGATAWLAMGLANRMSDAYFGLVLCWAIVIPTCALVGAEVLISTPEGSVGWSRANGPGISAFRSTVEWLLRFSPSTAMIGALQGHLPGDAVCGWREAGLFSGVCLLLGGLLYRQAQTAPPSVRQAMQRLSPS